LNAPSHLCVKRRSRCNAIERLNPITPINQGLAFLTARWLTVGEL
jgi:hypothetical protein